MLTQEDKPKRGGARSRQERKAARFAKLKASLRRAEATIEGLRRQVAEAEKAAQRFAASEVALKTAEATIEGLRRQIAEAEKTAKGFAASEATLKTIKAAIEGLQRRTALTEKLVTRPPWIARPGTPSFPSPAISVVTPTFNRAWIVSDAIASVVGQTFADWELIVVDDGSTDDSETAIPRMLSDPRFRYFRQEHAGAGAARNRGIHEARGALLAFLDSDNLYYPGFLAAAVDAFRADPALDVAYGALVSEHHDLRGTEVLWRPFDRELLLKENFVDTSTLVCRKSASPPSRQSADLMRG